MDSCKAGMQYRQLVCSTDSWYAVPTAEQKCQRFTKGYTFDGCICVVAVFAVGAVFVMAVSVTAVMAKAAVI